MPRTAGAINHLQRIRIDGNIILFPTAFLEKLQAAGYKGNVIVPVIKAWAEDMDHAGYPQSRVHAERVTIADEPQAKSSFAMALAAVTNPGNGTTTVAEEDDEEDVIDFSDETTIVSVAEPATTEIVDNAAVEMTPEERDDYARKNFITDDNYFMGIPRLNPPHRFVATLKHNYVNGETTGPMLRALREFGDGRFPLFLVGEAGSGKSEFSKYVSVQTGRPHYMVCFDAQTEKQDVFGQFVPDGKGGFVWEDGPATLAAENGGILALEEYSMAKQAILAMFRELLTGNRIVISSAAGYRVVVPDKNFRIIATDNGRLYAGTNELSLAEHDRFHRVYWDYPNAEKEAKILDSAVPGMKPLHVEKLIEFANETRAKKKNEPEFIRYVCSTRTLIKVCHSVVRLGSTLREALEDHVLAVVQEIDSEEYKYIEALVNARFPENSDELDDAAIEDGSVLTNQGW
jgi:nitric oxide reductase NorQ protein